MNLKRIKKKIKRVYKLRKKKYVFYYITNKIRNYFLKLSKSTIIAYPSDIMIELTNHCNLTCTICPREYDYGKQMDKGNMKEVLAKRIIDEVYPYVDSIMLTGLGETFMYKGLETIIDYIRFKNSDIKILVSTNAVLPKFIEKASET